MTVAAGVVPDVGELAMVAPFDGTAQDGGAAGFNGLHQSPLVQGQGVSLPVSGAVLSKDVGQLQGWRWHGVTAWFYAPPVVWPWARGGRADSRWRPRVW